MPVRKLRNIDGSGGVTLPKDDLRRDGLIDEDGEIREAFVEVDRTDEGEYLLRAVDPDEY